METARGAVVCGDGAWVVPPLYCVSSGQASTVEASDVITFTVTIATDSDNASVLDPEWAWSVEDELRQAMAVAVGVMTEQVYILDIWIADGDYPARRSRRLTQGPAGGGLSIDFLIHTYAALDDMEVLMRDIMTILSGSMANSSAVPTFITTMQKLLGEEAPVELSTASVTASEPQEDVVEVPQAVWRAVTDWGVCSNLCGVGVSTRQVECSIGNDALCNANSPAGHVPGDASSYYPDVQECQQYAECGFDLLCPSGPDPDTGHGCVVQGAVFGSIYAASLLLLAAGSGVHFRRTWRRPRQDVATLDRGSRSAGARSPLRSGDGGKEVCWDVDANAFNQLVDLELGDSPQSRAPQPIDPASGEAPAQEAYELGQRVEYLSAACSAWVSARIRGSGDVGAAGQELMPLYDCIRTNDDNPTEYVTLERLRVALEEGEPCEMYSKKYRRWLSGEVTQRSRAGVSSGSRRATLGYSLRLEDPKGQGRQPLEIPAVPPVLVRRRYLEGSMVQVYAGRRLGWVDAVVLAGSSKSSGSHSSRREKASEEESDRQRVEDEHWKRVAVRVGSAEARRFLSEALDHRGDAVVPVCERSSQDSDVLALPSYLLRHRRRFVDEEASKAEAPSSKSASKPPAPSMLDRIGGATATSPVRSSDSPHSREEALTPRSIFETPTHTLSEPLSREASEEIYSV